MLKIVQRSDKKKIRCQQSPPWPGSKRCKLCLGGMWGSYGRNSRTNSKKSSFDWKLKVVVHFSRLKCDQRAVNLTPDTPFLPNASDKNFEIAILLKIVQRSDKKNLVLTVPHGPGAGVVSYVLGVCGGSYGRYARTNFKRSSFDWKLKLVVHFSRIKCNQRAFNPPPRRHFSLKCIR